MQLSELKIAQGDDLQKWQNLQDERNRQKRKLRVIKSRRAQRNNKRLQKSSQRQLKPSNHLFRKR